jgi:2-oxoisovalerate dehydrogenase E1 component
MYTRPEKIHENFLVYVKEGRLPEASSTTRLADSGLARDELLDLFETQCLSRHLDLRARELKNEGRCYYTIGSAGHEGNAALGKAFRLTDMAFLHYRSGAFFIQRAKHFPGSTPVHDMMLSFVASSEDPIAGGRHKVLGSRELFVPPQTSTIASHLPKALGTALSISRARDLKLNSELPKDALVYCSFGDASANHASAAVAINSASWISYQNVPVPLVFVCEDNGVGISVPTPNDWIAANYSNKPGIAYYTCDGLNLCDTYKVASAAIQYARVRRRPVFLHVKTVRLMGHAGSDVESTYRSLKDIEATEFQDPLLHSARRLVEDCGISQNEVLDIYHAVGERVAHVAEYTCTRPKLTTPDQVRASLTSCDHKKVAPPVPTRVQFEELLGREAAKLEQPLHLAKLLSFVLHESLLRYPGTVVFGEDVAQKGGVYNVSEGLYKRFGVKRVFNSLLDETTILGTAIGMGHNGFLPIPEIQFLAYVHNAEDQLRGEASTLAFFSDGQYTNPMVVRIAGLPYQKGFGGHFHNDNSLAVFRDIPGIVVAVPSNGADAVKIFRRVLRLAYEEGRVVVFIEPIALYMTRDLLVEGDKLWTAPYPALGEEIELGAIHVEGNSDELAIVSYGNGYYHARGAQSELKEKHNIDISVIDLRWISPLPMAQLLHSLKNKKRILIVDETRKTGSVSEAIVAGLVEGLSSCPPIRVFAADDCFIPLGAAAAAGLPKRPEIVLKVLEFLKGSGAR